jgi:excisionase family DNA binding protein
LGIGKSLCWRLVACGEIPSIKLGTRRLVVRSALERLLEGQGAEQGERLRVMR